MISSQDVTNISKMLEYERLIEVENVIFNQSKDLVYSVFADYKNVYMLESDNAYYVLIALVGDCDESAEITRIRELCIKYRTSVNREFTVRTSLTIATIAQDMRALNKAYEQVNDAMRFIRLMGSDNEIVYYPNIERAASEVSTSLSMFEQERFLSSSIRARDFTAAKTILNGIIENDFKVLQSNQLLRCKVFSVISTVIAGMQEVEQSFGEDFIEQLNPFSRLLEIQSVSELSVEVGKIFDECVRYLNTNQKETFAWMEDVKKFILENYSDINLIVGAIAEQFNFSLSYLSRVFKKNTGLGLFDYIQAARIEESKRLIASGEKINVIASRVGYLDSRTFIRVFKKHEGVTPGKYV